MSIIENQLRIIYGDIVLVLPVEQLREDIYAFKEECLQAGEHHIQGSGHLELYDFDDWLNRIHLKRTLPHTSTSTPADTFMAYCIEDGKLLGCCQLRHSIVERTKTVGGHIGYEIRPSERRKGYAKKMLMALLGYAKRLGLDEVRIDCDVNNVASARTILACGGRFEENILVREGGIEEEVSHYFVNTKAL